LSDKAAKAIANHKGSLYLTGLTSLVTKRRRVFAPTATISAKRSKNQANGLTRSH